MARRHDGAASCLGSSCAPGAAGAPAAALRKLRSLMAPLAGCGTDCYSCYRVANDVTGCLCTFIAEKSTGERDHTSKCAVNSFRLTHGMRMGRLHRLRVCLSRTGCAPCVRHRRCTRPHGRCRAAGGHHLLACPLQHSQTHQHPPSACAASTHPRTRPHTVASAPQPCGPALKTPPQRHQLTPATFRLRSLHFTPNLSC